MPDLSLNLSAIAARVTTLEDKYVRALWFEQINSGASGTVTPPTGGTIVLDQWAAGIDAVTSTITDGNKPDFISAKNSSGDIITATMDTGGNWTISDTPSAYPIAIIYVYEVRLENFDRAYALVEQEVTQSTGPLSTPTFVDLYLTGLNPSLPVFSNASKKLETKSAVDAFTAIKQESTEASTGAVRLATDVETVGGAEASAAITPKSLTARLPIATEASSVIMSGAYPFGWVVQTLTQLKAALGLIMGVGASLDVAAGAAVNVDANLTVNAATTLGGTASNAEALIGADTVKIVTSDDLKYVLDRRIQQYYGVSWDESADTYVRTGSTAGQTCGVTLADAFLPIQRRMRRCLLADDGTVNYYLSATDSTKKEDGVTAAVLDGTDGQVMVEIPKFWYRYGYSGTTHTWEISPVPLAGFEIHPAFMSDTTELDYAYVGAYEANLEDVSASLFVGQCHQTSVSAVFATADDSITIATRTGWANALKVGQKLVVSGTTNNNGTVTVKTIESATKITVDENLTDETGATTVIQTVTDTTATTGDKLASVSGVCPISGGNANGTRAHFRVWAANRGAGWSQMMIDVHSMIQLLYLTEYASFYSQSVLGYGIAAVLNWSAYNDYNPIAKTGNSNVVGNATGNTATSAITTGAGAQSVYLSYRGLENFYGHIWKFVDGFNINNNIPYLCNNPANFADNTTSNYTRPKDANGADITMHNANGYQGTLELNGRAFMPASLTGGSASAKITDYYYQNTGWRVAVSGGKANHGVDDGCFYLDCNYASGAVDRNISGRLVFRK